MGFLTSVNLASQEKAIAFATARAVQSMSLAMKDATWMR